MRASDTYLLIGKGGKRLDILGFFAFRLGRSTTWMKCESGVGGGVITCYDY